VHRARELHDLAALDAELELGALLAERSPTHYLPRYRMVTFTHLPYAYALERGRAQDVLVEQLLRGHEAVDSVDLDAAVRTLEATLPPLPRQAFERG